MSEEYINLDKIRESGKNKPLKNECLAEKENGHREAYLTWVHQGDGTNYFKCEMCEWVKLDPDIASKLTEANKEIEKLKLLKTL